MAYVAEEGAEGFLETSTKAPTCLLAKRMLPARRTPSAAIIIVAAASLTEAIPASAATEIRPCAWVGAAAESQRLAQPATDTADVVDKHV